MLNEPQRTMLDNAVAESFWSILKRECLPVNRKFTSERKELARSAAGFHIIMDLDHIQLWGCGLLINIERRFPFDFRKLFWG